MWARCGLLALKADAASRAVLTWSVSEEGRARKGGWLDARSQTRMAFAVSPGFQQNLTGIHTEEYLVSLSFSALRLVVRCAVLTERRRVW